MSIEVKDQSSLSFSKCVELVLSGIKYRLFRAVVTVAIIALAVAFLMTMLTESLVARRVAAEIDNRIAPRRQFNFWLGRIGAPLRQIDLTQQLATAQPDGPRWQEFQAWGGLNDEQMEDLAEISRRQLAYRKYFEEELGEGERRPMVGRARGTEIFDLLQDPQAYDHFEDEYRRIGRKIPTTLAQFRDFLDGWGRTSSLRHAIREGHVEAMEAIRSQYPGKSPQAIFAQADPELLQQLDEEGYVIAQGTLELIEQQAQLAGDTQRLQRLLQLEIVIQRLATARKAEKEEVNTELFFSYLSTSGGAQWLKQLTQSRDFQEAAEIAGTEPFNLAAERIQTVAESWLDQRRLAEIETSVTQTASDEGGFLGFSGRALWLIIVSFVVCVVGIANAMLMSVTERFREIATMKCLGATDQYIMTNFILESCLQGTAGGIVGALLGFLLGLLRSSIAYGWMAMEHLPGLTLLGVASTSLVVGVILSALAAVYPAWIAARLAPMEAMRIE